MSSRKYASDYRLENHITSEGKIESTPIYQGRYFTFTESAEQIVRLRKMLIFATALILILLLPMLLDNTRLGRTIYIVLPAFSSFVPIYLLIAAIRRLFLKVNPFNREHRDKTDKRIGGACVALVVCLALSCAGCLVHFILNGVAVNEILCVLCLFLALAVSVMLLPWRRLARTREVTE